MQLDRRLKTVESICITISCALSLAACGFQRELVSTGRPAHLEASYDEIAALADNVDRGFEDGWICGRESRVLKSNYRRMPAETKAQFAVAYHDWLSKTGEDLSTKWKSYVPYAKRAQFAEQWWSDPAHCTQFIKEKRKYQVLWMHEALLDANELWWRVAEAKAKTPPTTEQVAAHEVEQDMVFNYQEDESHRGSISTQL